MARSCALVPKVLNKNGQKVDSKLYKDLLSFLSNDRESVNRIYYITKNEEFQKSINNLVKFDDNNEPTVASLLEVTDLRGLIPEEKVLQKLNKDIGYYKNNDVNGRPRLYLINAKNRQMLFDRAHEFNTKSEFRNNYVAEFFPIFDHETNSNMFRIKVSKKDKMASVGVAKREANESLNKKLTDILASHGVSVGVLSNLEERRGINGVTDFDAAKDAATGLVEMIRIAHGVRGEQALPEEFAHFAIEAMGDNPLVTRLVNNILTNDLTRQIIGEDYDTYDKLYEGDKLKLAKEAAGKLLAKHLLQNEEIPVAPYKNILHRVIDAIKEFFKSFSASDIQRAMKDADKEFGNFAKQILNGSLDDEIKIENIQESGTYFNTTDRITRDKRILNEMLRTELKRLKIYSQRNPQNDFEDSQTLFINALEEKLEQEETVEGIYMFLDKALNVLTAVNTKLVSIQQTPGMTANEKAGVLRDVRNYVYSYRRIVEMVRDALLDEELLADNRYGERVKVAVDNTSILLDNLYQQYKKVAMPLFVDFVKPFVGESITIPFGKWKGKTVTVEELIAGVKRNEEDKDKVEWYQGDISFFDCWLDSMADSSDYMLKIMDQAVKKRKETARLSTIDIMKQLEAATIQLEQAGYSNTDWMFERDEKGNLTGNYISEIDWGLYRRKKSEMYKRLKEKYGEKPQGDALKEYFEEKNAWFRENCNAIGEPKESIYGNKFFKSLSDTDPRMIYYKKVMEIKKMLDSYLPPNCVSLLKTVKIRKDLIERVKASDGVSSGAKQIWESIKDQFIRRSDDNDFSDRSTVKDFEGREVATLPIYYTNLRDGESESDISTDVVATLTAYAAMANDYHEMSKILNLLETGRDILREREEVHEKSDNPVKEIFDVLGRRVESLLTSKGDKTHFMQRLNKFFEMQVYGRYMKDEGTLYKTNIDKGKLANFINRVTSLNSLALNICSGISNVATGTVMMRIESLAGEYFTESDTLNADKNYGAALPEYLAEIGNRVKVSKLALWDELFNVLQEYETDVKEVNFDRKTWFSRMFGTSALFILNNAGEHWMQNRTSLALANAYKMKAPNGKIVSLWDAMEVSYIDKNNKKLGATLKVKEGYTKADGTAFTQNDIIAFSNKAKAINERMHGIYNKADRNAFQQIAIGRMGMMFRKWIKPSLNRRFKSVTYNFDMREWTEGYYRTTGRFMWQLAKELREGQFAIGANWDNLTNTEKANIKRATTEVGHLLLLALLLGLIDWPDDDDERSWLVGMAEYQARRLYTEVGAMTPGTQMASEFFRIVKSPAAAINTMEGCLDLIGLMNPENYETFAGEDALLRSGRFKGESRATKLFYESPLLPMNKTIYRGLHPEDGIPFFKQ